MASWIDLATTEGYAALLARINDRDLDAAKGFDPAKVTVTSPKTDTIRFNSASAKWEIYGGATWGDLVATYAISISGAAGSVPWSGITSKPTTLGGFGITDGQPLDGDLTAIAALGTTGFPARTAANTWALRTLTGPAAGLAVSNGAGVAGNPTLALANDLAALEGLGSTGFAVRTGTDAWAQRTLTAASSKIAVTNGNGVSGNPTVDVTEANLTLTNLGGTLTVAKGGTGLTTMGAKGAIAVATAAGTVAAKAVGGNGKLLVPSSGATDGLAWVGAGLAMWNGTITVTPDTPAANQMRVAVKTEAGNDPSAADPVVMAFRDPTSTAGGYTLAVVTAALQLDVSDGASFGFVASQKSRLYVGAMLNGSTPELLVYHANGPSSFTTSLKGFAESDLMSTVAMSASADSTQIAYSTTARSTLPWRLLGWFEVATEATAGQWSNAPTKIQTMGPGVPRHGDVIQRIDASSGGSTTTSTSLVDVTNASVTISPTSDINKVNVDVRWHATMASIFASEIAYFADVKRGATSLAGASAFRVSALSSGSGVQCRSGLSFQCMDDPLTTSATVYKLQHQTNNAAGGATTQHVYMRAEEVFV